MKAVGSKAAAVQTHDRNASRAVASVVREVVLPGCLLFIYGRKLYKAAGAGGSVRWGWQNEALPPQGAPLCSGKRRQTRAAPGAHSTGVGRREGRAVGREPGGSGEPPGKWSSGGQTCTL